MPVKGVIFDLDGTLLQPSGQPYAGVTDLLTQLARWGIGWVVTSNQGRARAQRLLSGAGLAPSAYATFTEVGQKKPSPSVCARAAAALGVLPHELIYVGDDERTDAVCAINSRVLYFQALWSGRTCKYGLAAAEPMTIASYLMAYLLRYPRWYWLLNSVDAHRRVVQVRSQIKGGESWNLELGRAAKQFLKQNVPANVGRVKFDAFLPLYFLSTLYLTGRHNGIDCWTLVPGHNRTRPVGSILGTFIDFTSKLFRDQFWSDLVVRHTDAIKAAFARSRGVDPGFTNQTNTLHLNPAYASRLAGKRVAVIDDYMTHGYSSECVRNLLFNGGASEVTCYTIGRYPKAYEVKSLMPGLTWNPWQPATFSEGDFATSYEGGNVDDAALTDLENALAPWR